MSDQVPQPPSGASTSVESSSGFDSLQTAHQPRMRIPQTVILDPNGKEIEQITALEDGARDGDTTARLQHLSDDDSIRPPSNWSETTNVPRRNLGFIQIFSLIINSIVGSGIFIQPGYVLAITKSKPLALGLWAAGGVYNAVTLFVFLEYGTALPYNGGPMVYLDECFHRPRLMVLTIFSFHRILLGSSASNCRTLAINLITLANPGVPTSKIGGGLIQLVAVVVIAVVCVLLYFMQPLCFLLNSTFAMFKVVSLLVLAIAGLITFRGNYAGLSNFSQKHPGFDAVEAMTGMIYVIFSYQGFVNVNCIAGEIKEIKKNLKYAGIISIFLITILYMFIVVVFYVVLDYESLTGEAGQNNVATVFAKKVFGTQTGVKVVVSLSGFATLLFQVYTLARVKQAIAWRRIIPFYTFFGRQDPQFNSPGGGLLLHGIFTAIPLLALSNSQSDVRNFALGIYSWGHQLIMIFLGLGLLRLKQRLRLTVPNWTFSYMTNPFTLGFIVFIFVASNGVILVMTALPRSFGEIPRWYWPITVGVVIGAAMFYWGILRLLMVPWGRDGRILGSILGFEPHIYESDATDFPDDDRFLMLEARHEGTSRLIIYKISGPTKALYDGYQSAVRFIFRFLAR